MLKIGEKEPKDIKLGSKDVSEVYFGIDKIWPQQAIETYQYTFEASTKSITFTNTPDANGIIITSKRQKYVNGVPEGPEELVPFTNTLEGDDSFVVGEFVDGVSDITVSNNESESSKSATIILVQNDTNEEIRVSLSQEAGSKVYENPIIKTFEYDIRDAAGGTLTPRFEYTQLWTWNGVSGSGESNTYNNPGENALFKITVPVAGASVDGKTGIVTWEENTGSERRCAIEATVTLNGRQSAAKTATAIQSADTIDHYGDIVINSFSVADVPASGGTANSGTYSAVQKVYYVSGKTTDITSGFKASYSTPINASSMGTTVLGRRSIGELTLTLELNGKSASKATTVYQGANAITSYGELVGGNLTANDIPAKGGSEAGTATLMTQTITYTSGVTRAGNVTVSKSNAISAESLGTTAKARTKIGDITATYTGEGSKIGSKTVGVYQAENKITDYGNVSINGGSVSDIPASGGERASVAGISASQTITYSSTATRAGSVSIGYSTKVSATSLGTTEKARTKVGVLTATYTGEGSKTASKSFDVYQQANAITAYGDLTGGSISAADISAAGGERTATITNMAQVITYTSGSTRAGVVSNTQTAKVVGSSLGTTVKARTKLGTITATFTGEGSKTSTKSVDVYQAANTATYGDLIGGSVSASDIPASGGTRAASVTNMTQTVSFTSGATRAGSVTNSQTAAITGSSLGTTVKARTKLGSITVSFTGEGSKTGSKAVDVYQQANAITTYGDVTISNGSVADIPASGGERTSASGMTTAQTITYTSGSTRAGSVSVSYSTKISGSSLGTTVKARTKLGTLTATATGEGSKTASKSFDVYQAANSATYDVPVVNATYNDISAAGSTVTPSVSYSQAVTYTSGSKSTVSTGGTISYSGTSVGTTNGAVSASSLGTTAKARTLITTATISVTVNGRSGSKQVGVYQAANAITSYSTPVVNLSYGTIGAGGGTVNPTISYSQTITYTSGSTKAQTTGGTITYTGASNNTTGAVTAASKGSTVSTATTAATVTATVSLNGKSGSKQVSVTQAANSVTYGTPVVSISYSDISAGGGSVTPTVSFTQSVSYTSGSSNTVSSGGTKSFSGTGVNTSTGAVSASSLGTTAKSRTAITTASVSITINGKTGSSSATVYQAANSITSYGNVSITGGSVSDIAASGGTVSSASGISASQTITYSSGGTRAGSVSISYSSAVTASSLGTTVKSRTKVGTLTATASGEGSKSATKAFDVYQAANAITNTTTGAWTVNISASPTTIAATGGSSTITASASAPKTNHYTSGSTAAAGNATATPRLSGSATGFTLLNGIVTAVENPNASTRSITVTATSNGVSKTVTVTQAASTITYDYKLSVTPSSLTFEAIGGTRTVTVVSRRQKMLNGKATGVYENVPWTAS